MDLSLLFWTFVRGIIIFLILYFLSVALYWYNRSGKIPPFRTIIRMMLQWAKWFPRILVHRVKIVPDRVRKKKVSPYPNLAKNNSSKLVIKNRVRVKKKK